MSKVRCNSTCSISSCLSPPHLSRATFLLKSRDCTLADFLPPRVIGCQTLGGGVVWKIGNRATPVLQTISQLISFSSALPPILSSSSQCKKRLIRRYVQCTLYIVQTLIFVEGSICKMFSREFESWLILCQQLLGPKIPLCWVLCFLQV